MKISLVVTVYNCEEYLCRCLESVKKQTYDKLEIIIVDDGSGDMSAQLCDQFAKERTDVKVIHKPNGGTVSARKAGIEVATGDVVCFVDGDDWIDKEFCSRLIYPFVKNKNVDIVSSGLIYEYVFDIERNYSLYDGATPGIYEKDELESCLLPNFIYDINKDKSAITTSICCKMIKRSIAMDAMNDMDDKLTLGEDGAYVLAVLLRAQSVYVMKEAFYHYEQHSDSQNNRFELFSYEQLKRLQRCMNMIANKANKFELVKIQIDYYVKSYLKLIQKSVFDIDEDGRVYVFPDDSVEDGSYIIIHGAGKVGQQYVKYVKKTNRYKLVAWTDKNGQPEFVDTDTPCSINEITKWKYDYIVLASNEDYILEQMKNDIAKYEIPQNKILFKKPISYRI